MSSMIRSISRRVKRENIRRTSGRSVASLKRRVTKARKVTQWLQAQTARLFATKED